MNREELHYLKRIASGVTTLATFAWLFVLYKAAPYSLALWVAMNME